MNPLQPDTPTETARLARLSALAVLDSTPEPLFDTFTRLAALICDAPIALISLIDSRRQWFKSKIGLDVPQTPREHAFCAYAIQSDALLEVADATSDSRFAHNPFVTGPPGVRFYAGAPLVMPGGERIGTLCVIDQHPRQLNAAQRAQMNELAQAVVQALLQRERALNQARFEAERRFRVLSDAEPVGVFHSSAGGLITHTNATWQRIFGMAPAQCLGDGWLLAIHPDNRAAVATGWAQATTVASGFEMDYRVLRPDGSVRQVHAQVRPIATDGQDITGYVGVVEDTTDRRVAENRLRASEALLERAGRIAGVGGWSLDMRTQQLSWSDQTCRIHDRHPGYEPTLEEALGYYTAQSRPLIEQAVQQAISGGTGWDLELPLVTAKGRLIWTRALGEVDFEDNKPVRLAGAFQDISARRQVEEALLESRQLLRVLYDATPALLQSIDTAGRLLTASDVWLSTLGYQRDQVMGRPATDFFAAASGGLFAQTILPALWRDGALDHVPLQMQCKGGALRDVLLSAVLDRDDAGLPRRALILLVDITDDLARQAELKREQALRQQIQRHVDELKLLLEERSDMLNLLAHEVRQPLNNASAALQSAAASLLSQGEQAASVRLHRAQNVMTQVLAGIDNTLAAASLLSGASPLEWQDTDIDTLINVSVGDLPVNERQRISVQRDTTTRTASMDMGLLRLALRNLLANALKYSPPGSAVRLHITETDRPLALILEVSDEGAGFAQELLPRLFERGAHGAAGGHGLGLHIVRRVMALHEGRVELVRNTAQGSTLRLVIAQHLG